MATSDQIKKTYQLGVIIAVAFLLSLAVYILLAEIIKSAGQIGLGNISMSTMFQLRYIFYGIGVVAIILIRWLRSRILRKKPDDSPEILLNRLLRALVLSFALSEIPAILGFGLFLLGGLIRDFYILTVISFVLMFMFFPRYPHWRDWVEEVNQANCCYPR